MKKSLLLLSLFFSCAYTQTLSLEQSIEKTLLNNPDIQSFILKTELSQKNYDVTFADNLLFILKKKTVGIQGQV